MDSLQELSAKPFCLLTSTPSIKSGLSKLDLNFGGCGGADSVVLSFLAVRGEGQPVLSTADLMNEGIIHKEVKLPLHSAFSSVQTSSWSFKVPLRRRTRK